MTLKVMSRPGRITMAGHIMTIVRNILGEEIANNVGKIRMLRENGEEVCLHLMHSLLLFAMHELVLLYPFGTLQHSLYPCAAVGCPCFVLGWSSRHAQSVPRHAQLVPKTCSVGPQVRLFRPQYASIKKQAPSCLMLIGRGL